MAGANGFSIASADEAFKLKLRGYIQADARFYMGDSKIDPVDTFLLNRVRPVFEGTVFRIGYDLFEEVRLLLTVGQPPANEHHVVAQPGQGGTGTMNALVGGKIVGDGNDGRMKRVRRQARIDHVFARVGTGDEEAPAQAGFDDYSATVRLEVRNLLGLHARPAARFAASKSSRPIT